MELLKSTPKLVDRNSLYYNKFKYKARLRAKYLNYMYYANTIDDYRKKIEKVKNERLYYLGNRPYHDMGVYNYYTSDMKNIDYAIIEKLIDFRNSCRSNKDIVIRLEYAAMDIYTNDISLLNKYYDISPNTIVFSEAIGNFTDDVMFFSKEPKFKYRVYLKSKRMPDNFKHDFLKFVTTHPSVNPCNALVNHLTSNSMWRHAIPHDGLYLEYDDESTITLICLMFPGVAGKTYKLEKR